HSIHGKVLSAEGMNQDISRLHIGIVGFGHLGKSIALRLKAESLRHRMRIVDLKPEAREEARKSDFLVSDRIEDIATESDLVIIATSSQAFTADVFAHLKSEVCLVCVTSSDDLFTEAALKDFNNDPTNSSSTVTKYVHKDTGKVVFLAANGGSVNFLIGSTPHPILHAVLASVYVSAVRLIQHPQLPKFRIHSIDETDQKEIQSIFEEDYGKRIPPTPEESWGLPDNPIDFIGRTSMLEHLKKTFETQHSQYVFGVEGVGKSTLATKFAHMTLQRGDYQYILWINAESSDSLLHGFRDYLSHDKTEPESTHDWVNPAYTRLASFYNKVLIIFNNASDMETLNHFLPNPVIHTNCMFHCLMTLSKPQFAPAQNMHELKPFSREEACNYIKTRLPKTTDKHISDLANHLNNLPLALSQAIEFISIQRSKNKLPVSEHIDSYINSNRYLNVIVDPIFIGCLVGTVGLDALIVLNWCVCNCPEFKELSKISTDKYRDFITNCTYNLFNATYIANDCPKKYCSFFSDSSPLIDLVILYYGIPVLFGMPMMIRWVEEFIIFGINLLIPKEKIKAVIDKIIAYPYIDGILLLLSARNFLPDSHNYCDRITLEFQYYALYAQLFVSILRSHNAVTKFMQITKAQNLSVYDKQKVLKYNLLHYYAQIALSILAALSIAIIIDGDSKNCLPVRVMIRIVYACNIISALSRLVIYKQEHKLSTQYHRLSSNDDDNKDQTSINVSPHSVFRKGNQASYPQITICSREESHVL
ncbi:MAG: NAD(P)-dependent oxidoreductase, partial [Methylococcales bacterium]|nr:NAD(P)-dependent oxidoreductase [Methylococcales bacterium]